MARGRTTRVLRRALDLVDERRHWTKGDYREAKRAFDGTTFVAYCWVGALRQACEDVAGEDQEYVDEVSVHEVYSLSAAQVDTGDEEYAPPGYMEIHERMMVGFNDRETTSYEDVVERMQKALKIADDKGL